MRTRFSLIAAALLVAVFASTASADIVDFLDFSNAGDGVRHDDQNFAIPDGPISGGTAPNDWVLTYNKTAVLTDSTLNQFQVVGGEMIVEDFGGRGTLTGQWTANSNGVLDIVAVAATLGFDAFNETLDFGPLGSVDEGIVWFYSINGGPVVEAVFSDATMGDPIVAGTDVSNTFSGIEISNGDVVSYGFSATVEGENTGVAISSVELDFAAVPEPTSAGIAALGLIGLVARRRR